MSATQAAAGIERQGDPAPVTRLIGWMSLGALAAFLIVNALNIGLDLPKPQALLNGRTGGAISLGIYVAFMAAGAVHVLRTPDTALRWDADRIHRANVYVIRGFYFGILFVGIADMTISFLRVENILANLLSRHTVLFFERPDIIGIYIHLPLILLGFLVATRSRTLGFHWLALLIIVAELMIVISRFVFSYEQAFMGDLVRYWYSALFLLASAYTLYEEGHVRVDVLYAGLRRTTKGMSNVIGVLFLGMPTAWIILAVGFAGPQSIINSPVMNFEITQTGGIGMYVKYQMAAFLGIFGATMLIQFVSMLFESMANYRDEPGRREHQISVQ